MTDYTRDWMLFLAGAIGFGIIVVVLAIRSPEYRALGIAFFALLALFGLSMGIGDGFGLGSWMFIYLGVLGIVALIFIKPVKKVK
ncbi:hypothetical protein [Dehalogenimonas sp. 4OHTPN]|uniref:Uncharacterized protein n=1 Tax=Dehalogenimonas sp. 4OHTPN TaxID=3166643 RepID=A0AAU8GBQ3_9CHLR